MAAAALWVIDDAFWHREPGTATGDHLASGLVPVALALGLALAYPRLRPGSGAAGTRLRPVRDDLAGVADGVRHVAVDRLGGDDVTAILAASPGSALSSSARSAVALAPLDERPLATLPARALRHRGLVALSRRLPDRVRDHSHPPARTAVEAARRPAPPADNRKRARQLATPDSHAHGAHVGPRGAAPVPGWP